MAIEVSMNPDWSPNRYSIIKEKCPREIVMLRGIGCQWKKCRFCDYHLDCSNNTDENYQINKEVLDKVIGYNRKLEVINSGSFFELDNNTVEYIKQVVTDKRITDLYVESHYYYKDRLKELNELFPGVNVHVKTGVESFNYNVREKFFNKGIGKVSPQKIRQYFQDCCLLIAVKGVDKKIVNSDIVTALKHFDRICINVFTPNQTKIELDQDTLAWFIKKWYPKLKDDERVDVLLDNSAFGVGGVCS
jgi:IS1 family transposase